MEMCVVFFRHFLTVVSVSGVTIGAEAINRAKMEVKMTESPHCNQLFPRRQF